MRYNSYLLAMALTQFDLTDITSDIIGTQTNVQVSYHLTESDAVLGINTLKEILLTTQ